MNNATGTGIDGDCPGLGDSGCRFALLQRLLGVWNELEAGRGGGAPSVVVFASRCISVGCTLEAG